MSSSIDERIVSMEFDNQRFEKNISQSMQSLQKLDETVDDTAKSINNNFLDVSDGISKLDLVFAGFYTKIGGYLADLAVQAGKFAKSLSFDQIAAGFDKYTAETLAVQTITANTNNSLEHTYEVLADILDYTDKTSYHYDKMSNTISKFANQGIDLDQAALATKGIANWAAISGAGIEKADITMDALVRSMSNGFMMTREWRTISQSANMGTAQFKQLLIDTGKEMAKQGKASKQWADINLQNFEDVFGTKKLVTTEVMMEVLKKYGDETTALGKKALAAASEAKTFGEAVGAVADAVSTSWGKTFRFLFGNYEEAKRVWTGLQDAMLEVFMIGADYRNQAFEIWHNTGINGYKDAIEAVSAAWSNIKDTVEQVYDSFKKVFDIPTVSEAANILSKMTKGLKDFSFKLNLSTSAEDLENQFRKINNVQKTGKQLLKLQDKVDEVDFYAIAERNKEIIKTLKAYLEDFFEIIKNGVGSIKQFKDGLKGMFDGIGPFAKTVVDFGKVILDFIRDIAKATNEVNFFKRIAESISKVFNSIFKPAVEIVGKILEDLGVKIKGSDDRFDKMKSTLDTIASAFEWLADILTKRAIGPIMEGIANAFKKIKEVLSPLGQIFKTAGDSIKDFFKQFKKEDTDNVERTSGVIESLVNTVTKIIDFLSGVIKKALDLLKDLFKTGDPGKVTGLIKDLLGGAVLAQLFSFVKNLSWISSALEGFTRGLKRGVEVGQIFLVATALLELGAAIKLIGSVKPEQMVMAFGVISALLKELSDFSSKAAITSIGTNSKGMKSIGAVLIELSAAILILAFAIKKIGSLKLEDVIEGTAAVVILLEALTRTTKKLSSENGKIMEGAGQLIILSVAILILSSAVKKLGQLDLGSLVKGLGSVMVILLEFAAFTALMKGKTIDPKTGLAIIEIALGLVILQKAVEKFGKMPLQELAIGLVAVFGALALMGQAFKLMPKDMGKIGLGVLLVSIALNLMVPALKNLAAMKIEDLIKSIVAMGVALTAMAFAMQVAQGAVGGAAALLIMTAALIPFAVAIKMLSTISWEGLGKAILSILVIFGGFAAAGVVLGAFLPVILALAAAFALFGTGVLALASGLLILTTIGDECIKLFIEMLRSFSESVPMIVEIVAQMIIDTLNELAKASDGIIDALITLLFNIAQSLYDNSDRIGEALANLLLALLKIVASFFSNLLDKFLDWIGVNKEEVKSFFSNIYNKIKDFITNAIKSVVDFGNRINNKVIEIRTKIINWVKSLFSSIKEKWNEFWGKVDSALESAKTFISTTVSNIVDSVVGWFNDLKDSIKKVWDWVLGIFDPDRKENKDAAADAGTTVGNIKQTAVDKANSIPDPVITVTTVHKDVYETERYETTYKTLVEKGEVKETLAPDLTTPEEVVGNYLKGTVNAFEDPYNQQKLRKTAGNVFSIIPEENKKAWQEKSPSKLSYKLAEYYILGIVNGIKDFSNLVLDPSEELANKAVSPIQAAFDHLSDIGITGNDNPVITPVLDLSEIQNGARSIGSMFGNYGLGLSPYVINGLALSGNTDNSPTINMNIYASEGQDVEELANVVSRKLNAQFKQRSNVWR